MKKLNSLVFLILSFAFMTCNDEETVIDTQPPTVVISAPLEDTEFNEGESIPIEAGVKDDLALEAITLNVTNPQGETQTIRTLSEGSFDQNKEADILDVFIPSEGASGSFTFTIEAKDKAGNSTTESVSVLVLEADKNAPSISIHSPEDGTVFNPDDVISLEASVTDDSALDEVTVWITPAGGLAQLAYTKDPEDFMNEGRKTTIEEEISLSSGTPLPGTYTLTVKASDEHGNTAEESISIQIREVDTQAPSINIKNPVEGAGFSPDENISFQADVQDNSALESVTLSVKFSDGESRVLHTVSSEDYTNNNRAAKINEAISLGENPAAGSYTLTVQATDTHANTAEKSVVIHVREADPNAPIITIHNPADGTSYNPEETFLFEAGVQDESALESVTLSVSGPDGQNQLVHELEREDFINNSTAANISENISLGTETGTYTITVEASDEEGNTSDKSVRVVVVNEPDTDAPNIIIHNPVQGEELTTNEAVYIRSGVADRSRLDEVTVWIISPEGQEQLAHTENPADYLNNGREAEIEKTVSLSTGVPAPGTYIIMIRATDAAGNMAEESVSITAREVDTTAPTITVNSPNNGETFQREEEVYLDVIVEDDKELAEIHVKVTLGNIITIQDETITEFDEKNYHQVEGITTIPHDAPTGTYLVIITATDTAGNQTRKTLSFKVTAAD